eukprot:CAMPEP_0172377388 /NCGR_PEP_ID=MMETSP1060-20121228/68878_1 /TAXON_ID=37318 /ORGANISM="Pseudo-nitzschia pungens, Strain cf. cingulata" /LENGTH=344 /DNA_ID=CAMNT_0013105073 /DNA_START=648 /DNA_END=1682 /DNA_ORIENTATION=-
MAAVPSLVTRTTIRGTIAKLTLNHPERRNALSRAMLEQIRTNLETIAFDPGIRVVVLNASGPVFSSGHDLREVRANAICRQSNNDNDNDNDENDNDDNNNNDNNDNDDDDNNNNDDSNNASLLGLCSSVMTTIVRMPQPVVAQVEGLATAAGCQLVASCDLAYASPDASFATPGVDLGLFCSTPGVALGRCVHKKHAMHMLLTGEPISASEAERIGLVNAVIGSHNGSSQNGSSQNGSSQNGSGDTRNVVGDDNEGGGGLQTSSLDEAVLDIAALIASKSPRAIALGKPLFYRQLELPLDDAYRLASEAMAEHMDHEPEAGEGIDAFLAKRKPDWGSPPSASTD